MFEILYTYCVIFIGCRRMLRWIISVSLEVIIIYICYWIARYLATISIIPR